MSLILEKTTHHKTIAKNKKAKPIKVVYISNPMKFKTSASKFMALVQELTGQDSEFPPVDPTAFSEETDNTSTGSENDQTVVVNGDDDNYGALEVPIVEEHDSKNVNANSMMLDFDFGPFDHHDHAVSSTPMMLENFGGFFPSSLYL